MKEHIILFMLVVILPCGIALGQELDYEYETQIFGLAGPVNLEKDTTYIHLADFFIEPELIDSVSLPQGFEYILTEGNKLLSLLPAENLTPMMEFTGWINGVPYSIPLERSTKEYVTISFDPGNMEYNEVNIAGEMNGWNPAATSLKKTNGKWETTLLLNPGEYQYQIVVDGRWMLHPSNPDSIGNNQGGYNSLLKAGLDKTNKTPFLITDKIQGNQLSLKLKEDATEYFVYWQNLRLPSSFYQAAEGELKVHIPQQAGDFEQSYIRIWAYNENGISNDVLIPLNKGNIVKNADQLDRHDHHAMIIYNVFVDRFYNADPSIDRPLNIPEVLPKADYFGGDIKGVTYQIRNGYFDDLNVNTIWISPLVKNPEGAYGLWPDPRTKFSGYHGYWPISFTEIDDRYGTEQDLHEMVETAHEHGMNVLLDFVANHVHEEHPIYKQHPEWATDLYLPDSTLNTQKWDEHRLTTWFDTFMPSLDLTNPQVVDMLTDSAVYWIKKYKLDGFRHDATKHVPLVFWRTLTRKLKDEVMIPENKMLYQIGETYGNPELIGSYVSAGKLSAQFDFNVYDDAIAVFAKDDQGFDRLNNSLMESLQYYGHHNLMGYISGNQDRPRFVSLAGGALSFEEDTKLAGWTRDVGVGDPVGYQKLAELFAFIMTIPGIPVIYYADEIGDPGGNDPDNRRMMRFKDLSQQEQKVKQQLTKLAGIRSNNMEFIYGSFVALLVEKNHYAFLRNYFDDVAVVIFNNSNERKKIKVSMPETFSTKGLKSQFEHEILLSGNQLEIDLPANTYDILLN